MIESYELAFRMQGELPKLMDLSSESGGDAASCTASATQADRRLRPAVPAGPAVRRGRACGSSRSCHGGWDQHRNLKDGHGQQLPRPSTSRSPGCSTDLKQRGLLEGHAGDLGRRVRPHAVRPGRRRPRPQQQGLHACGWPAAASRAGSPTAQTDDYGYEAVEDKVHVHDWHATILHLLGLDHEKLTYRYAGRDMRLTDVKGNVVKGILA